MKSIDMKKIIAISIIVINTIFVNAQQDPQYTQYMYNMNIINPAYAGSDDYLSANFLGRYQWVGIEGAPKTFTLGVHSPVGNNVGLGLSVVTDKLGPVNTNNLFGDFSYTIHVGEKANLAFGVKAGISFFNANLSSLITNLPDASFINNNVNKIFPNVGTGLFYYTEKFYAGLSIPNLLETFYFKKTPGQVTRASRVKHYFLTSGYVFQLTEDIKFKPSGMLKAAKGAPLSIDVSGNFLFFDKLELGVSHRLNESVSAMMNIRVNNSLRVGYAYDYTLTELQNFNSGSHEVFLLFNFDFVKDKIKSPRFF